MLHYNKLKEQKTLVENDVYFGFKFIPGFTRYMIEKSGRVFDMKLNRFVKGNFSKGYVHFILVNDEGIKKSIYRHRALCLAFLPDSRDKTLLQVNHINGVKGDDRIENLEWCTCSENRLHAIYTGLTCLSKPVVYFNIATDDIRVFGSLVQCCKELKLNEKKVSTALGSGDFIYRDGLILLRYVNEEHRVIKNTNKQPVLVRDMRTGVIKEYESIIACANDLNMTKHNVLSRVENPINTIYRDYLQIKRKNDNTPWHIPENINQAYIESSPTKAVLVRYCETGEVIHYETQRIASKSLGISETTIHVWLESKGQPIFKLPKNNLFIQIKRLSNLTDWRIVDNFKEEYEKTCLKKSVLVKFSESGKILEYESALECAKDLNILPTTLSERLKSKGQKKFKPGIYVKYKHEQMDFSL